MAGTTVENHLEALAETIPAKTFVVEVDGVQPETVEDKQPEQVPDTVAPPAAAADEDDPKLALEEMKRQRDEERGARERAEAQARDAMARAQRQEHQRRAETEARVRAEEERNRARVQAEEAGYDSIVNGLQAAEQAQSAMQANYAGLMAEGKFVEAAEISAKLAEVGARIVSLRDGKASHDVKRTRQPEEVKPTTPRRSDEPGEPDLVSQQDSWLAQQDPYNAAWIRQHRDKFFGDMQFQSKAVAASGYAVSVLGIKPGTTEYYRYIDEATGLVAKQPEPKAEKAETKATKPPIASAPPSRSTPTNHRGQQNLQITLTAAQRDHARFLFAGKKDAQGKAVDPEVAFAQRIAQDYASGLCDINGKYFSDR